MENFLNFHPIYMIFPLLIALFCLVKDTKLKNYILIFAFIFIFICAETGSDYEAYGKIYKYCFLDEIHGEPLYLFLCKIFTTLRIPYNVFRVLFLTPFFLLFAYSLMKLSDNFALSFLISFLGFSIFLVSAYRQFATMAIFLFSIYLYLKKNKKITALILNFIAIFLHKLALLQFALLVIMFIYEKCVGRRKCIEKPLLKKAFLPITITCLVIRLVIFVFLKTSIGAAILAFLPYQSFQLVDLGFVARILEFVILTLMYLNTNTHEDDNLIFSFYFLTMLLYIIIPLELIMERLVSNFRLLVVVLIPNILWKKEQLKTRDKRLTAGLYQIVLLAVYVILFVRQLTVQSGYGLIHMLWR